jgi:hypothetical protein
VLTPVAATFGNSSTRVGWTVGAGLEGVVSGNWTAKIEYLYIDLGTVSGSFATPLSAPCGASLSSIYRHRQRVVGWPELQVQRSGGGAVLSFRLTPGKPAPGLVPGFCLGGGYTTLPCRNSAISPALKPNSASTSSVCSPNSGGRAAILLGVRESVTGWPTRRI